MVGIWAVSCLGHFEQCREEQARAGLWAHTGLVPERWTARSGRAARSELAGGAWLRLGPATGGERGVPSTLLEASSRRSAHSLSSQHLALSVSLILASASPSDGTLRFFICVCLGTTEVSFCPQACGPSLALYVKWPFPYCCYCHLPFLHWVDGFFSFVDLLEFSVCKRPCCISGLQAFSPVLWPVCLLS